MHLHVHCQQFGFSLHRVFPPQTKVRTVRSCLQRVCPLQKCIKLELKKGIQEYIPGHTGSRDELHSQIATEILFGFVNCSAKTARFISKFHISRLEIGFLFKDLLCFLYNLHLRRVEETQTHPQCVYTRTLDRPLLFLIFDLTTSQVEDPGQKSALYPIAAQFLAMS